MESRLSEDKRLIQERQVPQEKDKVQQIKTIHVTVGKGLSKDEILKVVQSRLNEIEKCLAGQKISGTLTINLTINADGTLKNVAIARGIIQDEKIRQCIMDQIKRWPLPARTDGRVVKASIVLGI